MTAQPNNHVVREHPGGTVPYRPSLGLTPT